MDIDHNMREYIKGFEAGCDFIMREIENYMKQTPSLQVERLIKHLLQEKKDAE